jgi:hypothetical protein
MSFEGTGMGLTSQGEEDLMIRLLVALAIIATALTCARADNYSDMAEFAQSICGDIPEGKLTRNSIEGKVEAKASMLAKIISGDANVSASRTQEIYKGIPFDKLPDKIPTIGMCKIELIKILLSQKK